MGRGGRSFLAGVLCTLTSDCEAPNKSLITATGKHTTSVRRQDDSTGQGLNYGRQDDSTGQELRAQDEEEEEEEEEEEAIAEGIVCEEQWPDKYICA